jgi:ribonuclease T2
MSINPNHQCQLPSPKRIWTIHGLWPTKDGEMGPFYCNPDWEFDINQIKAKLTLLEQFWVNIQKGTDFDSLWRHEWDKHGTCAAQLIQLNNEDKYFGQGLNWLQQYQMSNVLEKSNITPDKSISVREVHSAIYKEIKAIPVIHCIDDKETHVQYLHELRICFNKTLNVMDCTGAVPGDKVWISDSYTNSYTSDIITNCDLSREVHYPATVPPTRFRKQMEREWKFPFVNFYKLIGLVKWMTF